MTAESCRSPLPIFEAGKGDFQKGSCGGVLFNSFLPGLGWSKPVAMNNSLHKFLLATNHESICYHSLLIKTLVWTSMLVLLYAIGCLSQMVLPSSQKKSESVIAH